MNFFSKMLMTTLMFALTTNAFAGAAVQPTVPVPLLVEQRLNQSANHAAIVKLGSQVTQKKVNVMKAVYDVSVLGGTSGSSYVLRDAAGGPAVLPKGAVIKQVLIDVLTGFTVTGGGVINVSLGAKDAPNDLKAATSTALYTGLMAGQQLGTAVTMTKLNPLDTNKTVTVSLSGLSNVSAGKLNVFIEYYLSN